MTGNMEEVWIIKKNGYGKETWRYAGNVLQRYENSILIEAFFNRPDTPFHGMLLGLGDRFLELYFNDRWYNIFEIHDRKTDTLKGWYCNVTCPAEFSEGVIAYVDLALDLLVFPDGKQMVLDEDEFSALDISPELGLHARQGLAELVELFKKPFSIGKQT
jgi:protein associated with RNAse G/E